jgi:hypothetical protein
MGASVSIRFSPGRRRRFAGIAAACAVAAFLGVAGGVAGLAAGYLLAAWFLPVAAFFLWTGLRPRVVLLEDTLKVAGTRPIRYSEVAAAELRLLREREFMCLAFRDPHDVPLPWRLSRKYLIRNMLDVSFCVADLEVEPKDIVPQVLLRIERAACLSPPAS